MNLYPLAFKAAVLEEHRKPLKIKTIEFPGPLLVGQVLVKLKYSGICGKQIEEIDGTGTPDPWCPHLLGHEGSGEVIDVGPGVTKVKKKDFVVMHWMKGSGIHSATPLYYHQGTQINSGWITTFNEYAVVSENRITPIDGGSDPIVAALLGCIASTGIGVIVNEAKVQPFDTVLVYGCGGIGLCTIQAAHMVHPQQLIAIDINDQSLAKAKEFGATVVINAIKEDVLQRVRELTDGLGATKVLVTTGHPKAIENAIEATSIPGECILVGVPTKGEMVKIDPWSVMHKRSIKGTLGGDIWPDRDVPAYYHLFDGGHIPLDKLVTHISSFDQINEAIEVMRSKSPGRSIIKF